MNSAKRLFIVRKLRKSLYNTTLDELEKHQAERIQEMGEYVKKNSPYYSEVLKDIDDFTISSFPKMDKRTMSAK